MERREHKNSRAAFRVDGTDENAGSGPKGYCADDGARHGGRFQHGLSSLPERRGNLVRPAMADADWH